MQWFRNLLRKLASAFKKAADQEIMMADDKKRLPAKYSHRTIVPGTRRPEVWIATEALKACGYQIVPSGYADADYEDACKQFQRDHDLSPVDSKIGGDTWGALIPAAAEADYHPPLWRRCQVMVTQFEADRRNAYGFAENEIKDKHGVPDGAGSNYGVVCHNSRGSMRKLLLEADRRDLLKIYEAGNKKLVNPEIKHWVGSPEGIRTQDEYFQSAIYTPASIWYDEIAGTVNCELAPVSRRLKALLCDIRVQNGSLYSGRRKPFWRTHTPSDPQGVSYRELYTGEIWDRHLGHVYPYDELKESWDRLWERENKPGVGKRAGVNEVIMKEILAKIERPEDVLVLIAQYRSRCSSGRWWFDVMKRKMTIATGLGWVHKETIKMFEDFGI